MDNHVSPIPQKYERISSSLLYITYHRSHGIFIERVISDTQHSRQNHRSRCAALDYFMFVCFRVECYNAEVDAACQLGVLLGQVVGGDIGGGNSEL